MLQSCKIAKLQCCDVASNIVCQVQLSYAPTDPQKITKHIKTSLANAQGKLKCKYCIRKSVLEFNKKKLFYVIPKFCPLLSVSNKLIQRNVVPKRISAQKYFGPEKISCHKKFRL